MTEQITPTEGMAQAILPYYTDGGKKARYLSYIMTGFSVMESISLVKCHLKSVLRWREEDPVFRELEKKCNSSLREELATRIVDMEFSRNFRLVLAKDFKILFKDATGQVLSKPEEDYLTNIRKFYTPQQYAMLKQMLTGQGDGKGEAFDFTKTVLTIRLEKEEHGGKRILPQDV